MSSEIDRHLDLLRQQSIASGENRRYATFPERQTHFLRTSFLENIKNLYGLSNIYYPGCGIDAGLEPAFDLPEITYMDRKIKRTDARGRGLLGDFVRPPFENGTFDSVYIRDLHLHERTDAEPQIKLRNILNTVQNNGIVIYGIRKECSQWQNELPIIESSKELRQVYLPFQNPDFRVFQIMRS